MSIKTLVKKKVFFREENQIFWVYGFNELRQDVFFIYR